MTFEGHIAYLWPLGPRAANKQYALQKSCYCPIIVLNQVATRDCLIFPSA